MIDEPKKTKAAVYAAIWKENQLLVLGRKKWLSEGTPWIMPGGGVNQDEQPFQALARELTEELGQWPEVELARTQKLSPVFNCKTEWTDSLSVINLTVTNKYEPKIDKDKFFGFIWLDTSDKQMIKLLWYQLMPGLRMYLSDKLGIL